MKSSDECVSIYCHCEGQMPDVNTDEKWTVHNAWLQRAEWVPTPYCPRWRFPSGSQQLSIHPAGLPRPLQGQCCFTSTETVMTIGDGEPRTSTSTFTQLLSFENKCAPRPARLAVYIRPGKSSMQRNAWNSLLTWQRKHVWSLMGGTGRLLQVD